MAKLSLDNFPQPQSGWKNWHKFVLIGFTIGIALGAWYLIIKANEKWKQAQTKRAQSEAMLKAAKQEKATREKATSALAGQAVADAISLVTTVAIKEAQNAQDTDSSNGAHGETKPL